MGKLTALAIALLTAGCAASAPVPDGRPPELPPAVIQSSTGTDIRLAVDERGVSAELAAAPASVWEALTGVWADLELSVDVLEPTVRRVGFERLTRSRIAGQRADALVRCGNEGAGPSAASRYRITLDAVSTVVAGKEGGAVLHTMVTGSAAPVDGSSTSRVGCVSLGVLEKEIAVKVAEKLGIATAARDG